jgi:hypothetical protein
MFTDDLNPQGAGSSKPGTPHNSHTNPNLDGDAAANTQKGTDVEHGQQAKTGVSECRLRANRENAKKSTGPKTARGKAYSRRNALTHGLTAKALFLSAAGTPIYEDLHRLWESLQGKYGDGDVRTDLLLETVVIEYFRQHKALVYEMECFQNPRGQFGPQGYIPNLQRYRTSSQRALLKCLELLEPQPQAELDAEENEAEDGDEAAHPTLESDNPAEPAPPASAGNSGESRKSRHSNRGSDFDSRG